MTIENERDLNGLKRIGKIVAMARDEIVKAIEPGITTLELDKIGEKILKKYGAKSAPQHVYNFPGITCISVNDEAAHGIPSQRIIKEGDSVNIDVSAVFNGYFADTGLTIVVGKNEIKNELCRCSKKALQLAINKASAGVKINCLGKTIHNEAHKRGFAVIKNLAGHGVGRKIHEEPDVLNYYNKWDSRILNEGLVLAVETFISTGAEYVYEDLNGWTLRTPDRSIVAQFEHTIVVTKNKPLILTA